MGTGAIIVVIASSGTGAIIVVPASPPLSADTSESRRMKVVHRPTGEATRRVRFATESTHESLKKILSRQSLGSTRWTKLDLMTRREGMTEDQKIHGLPARATRRGTTTGERGRRGKGKIVQPSR